MARLAKEVLAEIPDQFLSYMRTRGIKPGPLPPPYTPCPPPAIHPLHTRRVSRIWRPSTTAGQLSWPLLFSLSFLFLLYSSPEAFERMVKPCLLTQAALWVRMVNPNWDASMFLKARDFCGFWLFFWRFAGIDWDHWTVSERRELDSFQTEGVQTWEALFSLFICFLSRFLLPLSNTKSHLLI